MREPRKIDLLDIGYGNAQRLEELSARHPKKLFMGIDAERRKGLQTRRHNLKLVVGDAYEKLRRMPTASVKTATADFLFATFKAKDMKNPPKRLPRLVPRKCRLIIGEQILRNEVRELESKGDAESAAQAKELAERVETNKARFRVMGELRRVLVPGGKLVVAEYAGNLSATSDLLNDAGFPHEITPAMEGSKTEYYRIAFSKMAPSDLKRRGSTLEVPAKWPFQITATNPRKPQKTC